MAKNREGGKKRGRKYGRNRAKCALYALQHRRVKNNPARTQRDNERTPGSHRSPVAKMPEPKTVTKKRS
jgi:hypothetical protein